jgi:hypothetical protein
MEKTSQSDLKKALKKFSDGRIPAGNRLCNSFDGQIWGLKNEQGQTHTICEFKDGSYVLTDDLAGLIKKH